MDDASWMRLALRAAERGRGWVEPNPLVGCVIAAGDTLLATGWHQRFGGPHAEVEALAQCPRLPPEATVYVTLEPCCHTGKTPPCTAALLAAGVRRVVVAQLDPFPRVAGGGVQALRRAGVQVEVGVRQAEAEFLNAPYLKLQQSGRPFVLAKWAMSWDGKIATRTGSSRWISNEACRRVVHQLRGRMDGVLVGQRTAVLDNPRLDARPPGPRIATRIVADTHARLPLDSQLVATARQLPLLLLVGEDAPADRREQLTRAGAELLVCPGTTPADRLDAGLRALGARGFTNLLVEGGSQLLGSLFDAGHVDELHVFLGAKVVGGQSAPSPVAGLGLAQISQARPLHHIQTRMLDDNLYLQGRLEAEDKD